MVDAGYSENYAKSQGARMWENVGVSERIEELREEAKKRNDMSVDDIIKWLATASMLKIDEVAEVLPNGVILKDFDTEIPEHIKPFIQEITTTPQGGVQFKTIDKLGAIKELAKILGAYEKDNQQKTVLPPIVVVQAKEDD